MLNLGSNYILSCHSIFCFVQGSFCSSRYRQEPEEAEKEARRAEQLYREAGGKSGHQRLLEQCDLNKAMPFHEILVGWNWEFPVHVLSCMMTIANNT